MIAQQLDAKQAEQSHNDKAGKTQPVPFFIRLFNWEYWSFGAIYSPLYIYWILMCLRARSFFFFSASNPLIENGGFLMERKSDIYPLIPQQYYPKTILIKQGTGIQEMTAQINEAGFKFPLIVKPDIGYRGCGVKKTDTVEDAVAYISGADFPMLVQDFISFEMEAGIFYYRYPWERKGVISGIVAKEFLSVTGDGISNVEMLLMQNPRYILQLPALKKMKEIDLTAVPAAGEKKVMVPFGNHARGAKFIDASDKITPAMEAAIDTISQQIPEFHYGRLDIKFSNWEDLSKGKNLSIIELNGAGSEPTHMYDPSHSLFFAWREIVRHWHILLRISIWNHRHKKIPYLKFSKGLQMFKDNSRVEKKLNAML